MKRACFVFAVVACLSTPESQSHAQRSVGQSFVISARVIHTCPKGMVIHEYPPSKPFCLDQFAVTQAEFDTFSKTSSFVQDEDTSLSYHAKYTPNVPVSYVSGRNANEYCRIRLARLPTLAELNAAAHNGPFNTPYPWGYDSPTYEHACNRGGYILACYPRAKDVNSVGARGLYVLNELASDGVLRFPRGPEPVYLDMVPHNPAFDIGFRCALSMR